ncbi:MAG: hypothetical protein WCF27_11985 [Gaiellaceae bacterium]
MHEAFLVMRKPGLVLTTSVLALAGFALAGAVAQGASSHRSGCHGAHTCPSDHHTYVWSDLTTGLSWDCVEPGAGEYDAAQDTTVIVYESLTYYCRAVGAAPTTTSVAPPTTAPEPTSTLSTTIATTQSTSVTQTATTTTTTTTAPQVVLPNASITPGALNPKVRQATIRKTICKSGWTAKIRPPVSYTNALKIQQVVLYEEADSSSEYEEDHFIPLELGGAPRNPKNLWPEPRFESSKSDPLETKLKRKVCKGIIKLAKARAVIRAFKNTHG